MSEHDVSEKRGLEESDTFEAVLAGVDTEAAAPKTPAAAEGPAPQRILPILTTRNAALFPYVAQVFTIDRPRSVAAVKAAISSEDKLVAVFAQHDPGLLDPQRHNLYPVGTQAIVKQVARAEHGLRVTLLGLERIALDDLDLDGEVPAATVRTVATQAGEHAEIEALEREVLELAHRIQQAVDVMPDVDMREIVAHVDGPMHLVYLIASMITMTLEKAQVLLQLDSQAEALKMLSRYLTHELQVVELQQQIAARAQTEMSREQREYFLRRQLSAIQEELGESTPEQAEVVEMKQRFEELELPDEVKKEADRDLQRMANLPSSSADYQVTRAYLELLLELPWTALTEDNLDLANARKTLDEDHYGLKKVKERILEHLAVLKLNPDAKAPILCFVGAPGVGKTSLGSSIAHALGRRFERVSLGGVRDEAELRGHRRTYVGAMPGRIVQAIRRAEVRNPLLLLDEIDKVGRDMRGDPTAALLEILDPAQNHTFRDHYLNLPFDLSKVFFIATANTLDTLSRPLLDRMEIIRLSGYSDEEKVEIARRYLLPRQRREAGLEDAHLEVSDEVLTCLIRGYTREAGVRQLNRTLARLARKVALRCAETAEGCKELKLSPEGLGELLGPEDFVPEDERKNPPPGVVTGLAWTQAGGEVLYIEAVGLGEGDQLILTGQLGDVMKESARAAQSHILSLADDYGFDGRGRGVHIHVPAGAVPKDGPSAGVTMCTALASLYSGQPARADTAMTGEISLSGLVLPVGGIKEKVLAARRAGKTRVLLPKANGKDLHELPDNVRGEMEIVLMETVHQVLEDAIPELKKS